MHSSGKSVSAFSKSCLWTLLRSVHVAGSSVKKIDFLWPKYKGCSIVVPLCYSADSLLLNIGTQGLLLTWYVGLWRKVHKGHHWMTSGFTDCLLYTCTINVDQSAIQPQVGLGCWLVFVLFSLLYVVEICAFYEIKLITTCTCTVCTTTCTYMY